MIKILANANFITYAKKFFNNFFSACFFVKTGITGSGTFRCFYYNYDIILRFLRIEL
jgi:hypothetical protein